jgi:hypothetical protein
VMNTIVSSSRHADLGTSPFGMSDARLRMVSLRALPVMGDVWADVDECVFGAETIATEYSVAFAAASLTPGTSAWSPPI